MPRGPRLRKPWWIRAKEKQQDHVIMEEK